MQFITSSILFIASVAAQQAYNTILNPGANSVIQAGGGVQSITWTNYTSGNVSLALYSGRNPVTTVAPLATSIVNTGTFLWTPETWLPSGNDYTIGIVDLSGVAETQYSPYFTVQLCSTCSSSIRSTTSSFSAQTVSVAGLDIGTRTDVAFPAATAATTTAAASGASIASGAANTASMTRSGSTAAVASGSHTAAASSVPGLIGSSAAAQASALGASANNILSQTGASASPTTASTTKSDATVIKAGLFGFAGIVVALL